MGTQGRGRQRPPRADLGRVPGKRAWPRPRVRSSSGEADGARREGDVCGHDGPRAHTPTRSHSLGLTPTLQAHLVFMPQLLRPSLPQGCSQEGSPTPASALRPFQRLIPPGSQRRFLQPLQAAGLLPGLSWATGCGVGKASERHAGSFWPAARGGEGRRKSQELGGTWKARALMWVQPPRPALI